MGQPLPDGFRFVIVRWYKVPPQASQMPSF
jgi:hypothetical protein